jgi:polyisoprenoid-binding protein YceI
MILHLSSFFLHPSSFIHPLGIARLSWYTWSASKFRKTKRGVIMKAIYALLIGSMVLVGCAKPAASTSSSMSRANTTVPDDSSATGSDTAAGEGPAGSTLRSEASADAAAEAAAVPPATTESAESSAAAAKDAAAPAEPAATETPAATDAPPADPAAAPAGDANAAGAREKSVAVESGVATLSPENTRIEFVGIHLNGPPNPRRGGFEKFTGKAEVDAATKSLKSVQVEIDTTSIWTDAGQKLTDHLKSSDFFEVREFPTAKFETTKIEQDAAAGEAKVTGNLTLHGVTKEITFPAKVTVSDSGLTVHAQFEIDRMDYQISYRPDQVGTKIAITAVIGEKTSPATSQRKRRS